MPGRGSDRVARADCPQSPLASPRSAPSIVLAGSPPLLRNWLLVQGASGSNRLQPAVVPLPPFPAACTLTACRYPCGGTSCARWPARWPARRCWQCPPPPPQAAAARCNKPVILEVRTTPLPSSARPARSCATRRLATVRLQAASRLPAMPPPSCPFTRRLAGVRLPHVRTRRPAAPQVAPASCIGGCVARGIAWWSAGAGAAAHNWCHLPS